MAADRSLKISPELDDELARVAADVRVAKGTVADALLEYGLSDLARVEAALVGRIKVGLGRAHNRRESTSPLRPSKASG